MIKFYPNWMAFLLLLFSLACQTEQAKQDDMEFQVDAALLDTIIWEESLEIAYSSPKNWTSLPLDSALATGINKLSDNTIKNKINAIYADSAKQCFLVVNSLLEPGGVLLPPNAESLSKQTGIEWTMKEDRFRYAGFEVKQFFLISEEWVSFKLQFAPEAGPPFQLDFLVPKVLYPQKARIVESVIGSVRPLKMKK